LTIEGNYASCGNRAFRMPLAVCMLNHTSVSDNPLRKPCTHGTPVMRSHSLLGNIVLI